MWTTDKTEALNALLGKLDTDQRHVAAWRPADGNLRVVACAGAGKTTTTVALAADLVRSGAVPAERIVLATFSRKAGEELKTRLSRVAPSPVLEKMRVGTFHGLGLRALRGLDGRAWELSRCMDMDGRTRGEGVPHGSAIWRGVCQFGVIPGTGRASLKLEDYGKPGDYSMAIDLLRAAGYESPADVPADKAPGLHEWDRAWTEVINAKRALRVWDFGDVLAAWLGALRGGHLPADGGVVIVDEAQDNNVVQLEIARALAGISGRIILVGDLRQTIHVWRGSYPELFATADVVIGAQTREIPTNYRSLGPIVALGNAIALGRPWCLGAPATAARGNGDTPGDVINLLPSAASSDDEADAVARRIQAEIEAGAAPGAFAILARTNAARAYFEAALTLLNIPIAVLGGSSIFKTREAEVVLAYCALAQHDAVGSLDRVLNAPKRFLPAAFAADVGRVLGTSGSIGRAVRIAAGAGTLKRGSQAGALDLANTLERLRGLPWAAVPAAVVEIVQRAKTGVTEAADATDEDSPAIYAAVASIVARFPSAADAIDFAQRCAVTTAAQTEGERGGARVTLSTVHRSKGLEWDHVYVSATDGVFPHAKAMITSMEDERRLFYVAATRAVNRLTFSYAATAGRGTAGGMSRFLRPDADPTAV
jgi:DNA helicase-2/ATP-dependent DNA helicase PcrA